MRLIKKLFAIICTVSILISSLSFDVFATEITPMQPLSVSTCTVLSMNSGEYVISKNSQESFYPYSLTKMMTAIIAVKYANLDNNLMPKNDEMVTIGNEVVPYNKKDYTGTVFLSDKFVSTGLKPGDVISLPDLITAMVVGNGDDAAMAVAVYIGRKILGGKSKGLYRYDREAFEKFVEVMNYQLGVLGILYTRFDNPTGEASLTSSHTTVNDIARIGSEFMNNKFLAEIAAKRNVKYWDFEELEEPEEPIEPEETLDPEATPEPEQVEETFDEKVARLAEEARNKRWDRDLSVNDPDSDEYIPNLTLITASKTENGILASFYVTKNDIKIIIILKGADEETIYSDLTEMINYVFNNFFLYTFIEEGEVICTYFVENADDPSNETLNVCASQSPALFIRKDKLDLLDYEIRLNSAYFKPTEEDLYDVYVQPKATVTKGTVLGTLDIYYNTVYKCTVNLYAGNTVPGHTDLPEIAEKSWLLDINWRPIATYVFGGVLICACLYLVIKILANLLRPARTRRRYQSQNISKQPPIRYSRKRK